MRPQWLLSHCAVISVVQSKIDLVHICALCLRGEGSAPTCSLITSAPTTVLLNEVVCGLCEPTCTWLPYGGACSRLAAVHRCSSTSTEAFIIQPVIVGLVQPRPPRGCRNAVRHLLRKPPALRSRRRWRSCFSGNVLL